MNSTPVRDKSYVDTLPVNPLPASILNKSKEMQGLFISSLSASKAKGQSDNEATFAALAAVKVAEHKLLKSSLVLTKSPPARIPLHLQAILDTQQKGTKEQQEKALGSPRSPFGLLSSTSTAVPSKNALQSDLELPTGPSLGHSLVSADFNKEGKLELLFDDGRKIITNNKAAIDILEQHISVTTGTAEVGLTNPVNYIEFNQEAGLIADTAQLTWNDSDGTLDLGLKGGNVTLQIGQEQIVRFVNHTATDFVEMQVVRIVGAQGNRLSADLARGNSEANSNTTFAVVTEPIPKSQQGYATISGLVRDVNTSSFPEGAVLYLSPFVAGGITHIIPVSPNRNVRVGYCVRSHAIVGSIFVNIINDPELNELPDVLIQTPQEGEVLTYEGASNLWKNKKGVTMDDVIIYNLLFAD